MARSIRTRILKGDNMKKYLENLCDELDVVFTHLKGDHDWKEQVLKVVYDNLPLSENVDKDIEEIIFKTKTKVK